MDRAITKMNDVAQIPYRSGFVTFVGRPNVGKSTLMNALIGQKIAITSSKPQTTRRTIRGIAHQQHGQLIIVDTPGMHRPRTLLGQRLNDRVHETLADVDVIAMCFPANEPVGPGDRFINEQLSQFPRAKKVAIITKTDAVGKSVIAEQLIAVDQLREWEFLVPVSANREEQLDVLLNELIALMPESEQLYPDDIVTEESDEERIAELIREAALELVTEELPHSIAVGIDEILYPDHDVSDDLSEPTSRKPQIYASIYVERDSQKGIMIGKGGARLAQLRNKARRQIEKTLGQRVSLHIQIRVAQDWQRDPKQLNRLGF